jgi:hypothetical protein
MSYESKTFRYLACKKCDKNTIHNVLLDVNLNAGTDVLKESECLRCGMGNAAYVVFEGRAKILLPWLKEVLL